LTAEPARLFFITHPEVVIEPEVPVPDWSLSSQGWLRMRAGLKQPWVAGLKSLWCSTERKAKDGAAVLAAHLELEVHERADLGENDRSATGFLPPEEFQQVRAWLGTRGGCPSAHRASREGRGRDGCRG
jgi:hypothetical protein